MKKFLKKKWKPLAVASGLGGLLFGGAWVAYKKGYVGNPNPAERIPEDAQEAVLRTHPFEVETGEGEGRRLRCEYRLQKTQFKVWSIMQKQDQANMVYFITPNQHLMSVDDSEEVIPMESFYSLVGIPTYFKKSDLLDHVRKDSQVVFHLCLVGGGSTGILTGEKIISRGKLESWEFLTES